jgi:hypothetical protein
MEKIKVETESPKLTEAKVSQEVQDTIAKNLKATADAKKKKTTSKKKSSKPSFNKKKGKRSKELKAATTSLADVFKALKQN